MAGKKSKKQVKKAAKRLEKEQRKLDKLAKSIVKNFKEEPGRGESDDVKLKKIENNLEAREEAYRNGTAEAGGIRNPDFVYEPEIVDYVFPKREHKPKVRPDYVVEVRLNDDFVDVKADD